MSRWMWVGGRRLNCNSFIPQLGRSRKLRYLSFPNTAEIKLSLFDHNVMETAKLLPAFRRIVYLQSENLSHLLPQTVGEYNASEQLLGASWNVMAQAQKPDFVFRRNGRIHLNRQGASVQSTTGSRGVRISGSNAGYTMFRGNVKSTGYPLHSPVSPSLPLPCVTVCHHIPTGV